MMPADEDVCRFFVLIYERVHFYEGLIEGYLPLARTLDNDVLEFQQ